MLSLLQASKSDNALVISGRGLTVTSMVAVFWQLLASVPVTV
jgi:hypothetical protein